MTAPTTTLVRGARSTHTTIAWKMLMAVTGVVFLLYVLLHMYGNLKAFAGHDAYNDYAEHLRTPRRADAAATAASSGCCGWC